MRYKTLLAVFLLCGTAGAQEIEKLVSDLGDDNYLTRISASDKLEKLGPAARTQVKEATKSDNAETRLRAVELWRKIQIEDIWAPTRCNYSATIAASDILTEVARQTGNTVILGDQYGAFDDKELTVNLVDCEYWRALDQICASTEHTLRPHYDSKVSGSVLTSGAGSAVGPIAYSGPFRTKITSARRAYSDDLDYETSKSDVVHTFQLNFTLMWEDRFKFIAYRAQPELVLAKLDTGGTVGSTQPAVNGWNVNGSGTRQLTMNCRLHPPTMAATEFSELVFKLGIIAVGDFDVVQVDDVKSEMPKVYGENIELTITECEVTGQRCELLVTIVHDMVTPDQNARYQGYEFELLDQDGVEYRKQGQTNSVNDDDAIDMKLTFVGDDANSKPAKFKLHYPKIITMRDVAIAFKNVKIPSNKPE